MFFSPCCCGRFWVCCVGRHKLFANKVVTLWKLWNRMQQLANVLNPICNWESAEKTQQMFFLLPKQSWPIETWTPPERVLFYLTDGSDRSCKSCKLWGPSWIVRATHPTDAWLEWDLGNLGAKWTPQIHCCVPVIRALYPPEIATQPSGKRVTMKGCTRSAALIR